MTLLTLNSAARERVQARLATSPVVARIAAEKAKVEKAAPTTPKPNLDDVLLRFATLWPDCFTPPGWAPMRALKLHIHRDLVNRLPDVKPRVIASALHRYCSNPGYRRRLLVVGATRYGLDGLPAGVVAENEVPPRSGCSSTGSIPTSSTVEQPKAA